MAISELQLSNLIKHHLLLEYKEYGAEAMCIKKFLPLCAALIFPYKDSVTNIGENKSSSINPIIDNIKSFTRKIKGLNEYTFDSLRLFFKNEWLPVLEINIQRELLSNISLISKIEEDGFFSLNGNDTVFKVYLNMSIPDISKNYGSKSYVESEEITVKNITTKQEDVLETTTKDNNMSLNELKDFLLTNFPLNKYPRGLQSYDYFWEFKTNNNQYEKLKDILINLNLKDNIKLLEKEICGSEYGTVARSVALFVSEWYKRECDNLSGNKCLEGINLNSNYSRRVWERSGLPNFFLHQNDNEDQMRQIAMCALGGLPLLYVYQSNRFKQFVNGLFILQNNEEETTDEDIESIVDCFDDRNRIFKRSLKSGSCREYLIKLADYLESGNTEDLPFSESDLKTGPFSDFIKILQEGYDKALPNNFIQKEIRIWTYDYMEEGDYSNFIECEFYVHIGFLKSNNVITTRDLSKLGIMLPSGASMFDARLKIMQNNGNCIFPEEKRSYLRIGNHCNDFCGAYGSSLATSINLFNTKDITLLIECGDYHKEIPLYTIPSYLELYATDNGYLWTTKTNNSARKVLFYNKNSYTLLNEEDLDSYSKIFKDINWGWVYLTETIKIKNNSTGEEKSIGLEKSELIVVNFKTKSLGKTIELSKEGCVECEIKGEEAKEVPILFFDNYNCPMLSCDGLRGSNLLHNYKVEFKETYENNYSEWTTDKVPSQGFLSLRINCRDESKKKKPWRREVFCIPCTFPIVKRNLDNNYIYIKGENVCVLDESCKNGLTPSNGDFNYKYKDNCDNLEYSSIPFLIGNADNHIILKVYRAFKWTRILNNGNLIKDITNDGSEKPPVALILQKNIHLKVVNEEGNRDYSPCYQRHLNYFRDPSNLSFVKQGKSLSGLYIDEASRPYLYCVYISSFDDNGKNRKIEKKKDDRGNEYFLLNVSDKEENKKEYSFYYWSGELQDTPVRLELVRQGERAYRFDIPSPLSCKAVVFQSLRDCSPNLYFRPFYEGVTWDNYVQRYDMVSMDYIIKCYLLAVEHNVYFCIFPAIRKLQKRCYFSLFIREYAKSKNYIFSYKDNINLTRMAKELAMDWCFADVQTNDKNYNKKISECMTSLKRYSPVARALRVGDEKLCRIFNRAIKNWNKKYDGYNNTTNRIELLNIFVSD